MTALLLLILCAVGYSSVQELNICIKSDKTTICQQQNISFSYTMSNLSGLADLLDRNDIFTETLHVYLTSGNHSLATDLDFTGLGAVQIHGNSTQKSSIQCTNPAGIINYGKDNQTFLIENIILLNCSKQWNGSFRWPALHFKGITYELQNVVIRDSYGLHAYNCHNQLIRNCIFGAAVKINSKKKAYPSYINITDTIFSGSNYYPLGIYLWQKAVNISIDTCNFENYPLQASSVTDLFKHGSVLLTACSQKAVVTIIHCKFLSQTSIMSSFRTLILLTTVVED